MNPVRLEKVRHGRADKGAVYILRKVVGRKTAGVAKVKRA